MARLNVRANWLDRAIGSVSPRWGLSRMEARARLALASRHFEAAQPGRRTSHWGRSNTDSNAANRGALSVLRDHARDLVRNNAWAKNGLRTIVRNTVGWGINPKAVEVSPEVQKKVRALWRRWAGTTECDAGGRKTFSGIQRQIIRTVAESGEVLVRRRWRRESDGLTIPMQLQVLEPDFIDTRRDSVGGLSAGDGAFVRNGSVVIQGVEFDAIGRRVAYWLYDDHPGSRYLRSYTSRRVPASELIHVYDEERPGQVRGVSWLAAAIINLKDFDEYEDGTIMRQKIAALFSAFVKRPDGNGEELLGTRGDPQGTGAPSDDLIEEFEPGMIKYLRPGEEVEFANPPLTAEGGFTDRTLRRIAAALGVTYEDLTGDFSKTNYSSGRMGRVGHQGNVYDWQWNMMVPQFCDPAWTWAMEAALSAGLIDAAPFAEWTAPPLPLIDPDKEGLAYTRRVRSGQMTFSEMVREMGKDPETHFAEYAQDQEMLDELKIWLDSDVRRVSAAGLTQARAGAGGAPPDDDDDAGARGRALALGLPPVR